MTAPSTAGGRPGAGSAVFRWLPFVLGGVLLTAGVLKLLHHRTSPFQGLLSGPWLVFVLVEVELILGVWLLSGLHPRPARLAAMALFFVFAIVSLRQALANEVSCGCFGDVPIRPWWIFLFDLLALVGLLLASPFHAATIRSHPLRFRAALGTGLAFGVAAGFAIPWQGAPPIAVIPAPVDLGEIQAGGTASAVIRLENRANVPIRLAAIQTTCECLTLERTGDVIGPAEAAVATVTLDMKHKPDFRGRLRIEVVGKDTDGRMAFTLVVLAHVTRLKTAAAFGSGTPRAPCRS